MYTPRGRLTHVYASLKLIIGSADGLSPMETNAITGSLLIGPWKQCTLLAKKVASHGDDVSIL